MIAMRYLGFLLKVSRPRFWFYTFGTFLVGLAGAAVFRSDLITAKSIIFGLYFLFPANLLIYGINDIFDFETDKLNQKKQEYEILVQPNQHKKLFFFILLFNLPFFAAAFAMAINTVPALAGFLFFSIFYSTPPIRAKTKPFLDSVFNILYVFPGIFAFQLLSDKKLPVIIIIAAGIWTFAMHAYSAIPDIEADRTAQIKTIATQLGTVKTLFLCLILYLFSAILVYQYFGFLSIILGLIYASMIFLSYYAEKKNNIFSVYKFFPIINVAVGFILFWYIAYAKFF
ncbi:prenyltransferase [soil metagenome]